MEQFFPLILFFSQCALALLLYVAIWAPIAIYKKRADLADIAWGGGFLVLAWLSYFLSSQSIHGLLLNLLITIWALRLTFHIAMRNRHRKEDFRYAKMRSIFVEVFLLQGAILYIVALPILWFQTHPHPLSLFVLIVWGLGFGFETIADYQLAQFRKNRANQGKLMMKGLWRYSRHPNYFGEILQWWTIWAFSWNGFLLVSPILLTYLIVKVSGVAPLEEKMKSHPDFPSYAERTPCLIPYPKRLL